MPRVQRCETCLRLIFVVVIVVSLMVESSGGDDGDDDDGGNRDWMVDLYPSRGCPLIHNDSTVSP